MKPYKKHLLQSAFDLQSRLNGQVTYSSHPLHGFQEWGPSSSGGWLVGCDMRKGRVKAQQHVLAGTTHDVTSDALCTSV